MKDSEAVKRLCDVYDDKYERALKESEGKAVLRELCATLHSVAPIQARSVLPYGG